MHPKHAELRKLRSSLALLSMVALKTTGPLPFGMALSDNISLAMKRTKYYEYLMLAAVKIDKAAESSNDLTSVMEETAFEMESAENALGGNDPAVIIMKRIRSIAASGNDKKWWELWKRT